MPTEAEGVPDVAAGVEPAELVAAGVDPVELVVGAGLEAAVVAALVGATVAGALV